MTQITNADRDLIVKGLMRKTNFRARFTALKDEAAVLLNEGVAKAALDKYEIKDWKGFLKKLPKQFVAHNVSSRKVEAVSLPREFRYEDDYPDANLGARYREHDELRYYFVELSVGYYSELAFPYKPEQKVPNGNNPADFSEVLTKLNGMVGEFLQVEQELRNFLVTVRTVKQLQASMPEALEFVPTKVRSLAVIPEPANALAALAKNGFPEGEKV